jgi:hypothetical protein
MDDETFGEMRAECNQRFEQLHRKFAEILQAWLVSGLCDHVLS